MTKSLVKCLVVLIFAGCSGRQAVYTITGTTLGVDVSQNPVTQLYQAKLGYNRGEIAIVPTNRSAAEESGVTDGGNGGAKDATDVLVELRFSGLFTSGESSGLYQRLAVGTVAVQQPGAAFMFAKGHNGTLDAGTADVVGKSVLKIASAPTESREFKFRLSLLKRYGSADTQTKLEEVLKAAGYDSFDSLADGRPRNPSTEDILKIKEELKKKGISLGD